MAKILMNATKLVLISIPLLHFLSLFRQPLYKVQTSAQTSFENQERARKFIEVRAKLRNFLKGIASYIHATHIILCNIVLQKIPQSQRDNRWVQSLQETIDGQLYAGGEDSIALKILKEVSRREGSVSPRKSNKLDQETLAEELELLFRDSGKVMWIVKKHNDMILAIIKSLLSSPTF